MSDQHGVTIEYVGGPEDGAVHVMPEMKPYFVVARLTPPLIELIPPGAIGEPEIIRYAYRPRIEDGQFVTLPSGAVPCDFVGAK